MKKLFFTMCLLTAISFSSFSQQAEDAYIELTREVLKTEKKVAIAEAMDLTDEESTPFWDLYNEYSSKQYAINNMYIEILKTYSKEYETLTNEKADELYKAVLKHQQLLLNLEKKYYKKFKKILPAGKAARYFQAENKIETLVNAQMAIEIPLIETK